MDYKRLRTTGSVVRTRTTGVRLFALLAVAALLSSVNVVGAGRADAAPGEPTQFVVEKVDAVTGTPLADAHFTFYDHLNAVIGTCVTDATGFCHIDGTTDFSYQVKEDTPPPGYIAQPGIVTAPVITNPQVNPPLIFRDQASGTSLQRVSLKKVDASTGAPLQFAIFRLQGFVGATEICTTDQQGICEVDDVPAGSYEWKELAAPPGYDLVSQTSPLTVTVGVTPAVVTVEDHKSGPSSTLTVKKVDAETTAALTGAHFALNGANATCTTDADGLCSISGLSPGTYSWHETAAPAGYRTAADSPAIQITDATAGTTFAPTVIADAQIRTDLTVQKADAGIPGHVLAGATFDLTAADNSVVGSCTTTAQENGSCTVPNLPFGTYTWLEVAAPSGYDLPADPRSLPIDVAADNAGTTMPATIVSDKASRSTLTLKKVDAADHTSPLAGATYRLWREANEVSGLQATGRAPDRKIGECTTAADGTCSIDALPDGTYYWLEVSAPAGYALSAQPSDAVVVDTSSVETTTVSDVRLVTPTASPQTNQPGGSSLTDQPGGGLAFTGINLLAIVSAATVLLVAGALLLLLAHRRRRTT
jgi:large repetitive protein